MKKAIGVVVLVVLSFVAACTPAAPTPTRTPEPRPTAVEVLATKPEHLAGIWLSSHSEFAGYYFRFDADGTLWNGWRVEVPEEGWWEIVGRFWFDDGVYYEQSRGCIPIGSYRVYLDVEGGMAVRFRFEEIDDSGADCSARRSSRTKARHIRVD